MKPVAAPLLAALCLGPVLAGCGGGDEGAETARQGQKAPAPGVPTTKGGDNSIQTWGVEASAAKRAEAAGVVRGYLDARVSGDWTQVCGLLAAKVRAEQSRAAGGAPCPEAMAAFASDARDSVLREEAEIEVLSLRVGGGYAFLIYRRPEGFWAMPLAREGGRWRLLLASPNQIA